MLELRCLLQYFTVEVISTLKIFHILGCGLPLEYCEYGKTKQRKKCQEWLESEGRDKI